MSAMTTTVRDLTLDEPLKDARHALDAAAAAPKAAQEALFAEWAQTWGEAALIALDDLQGQVAGDGGFDADYD